MQYKKLSFRRTLKEKSVRYDNKGKKQRKAVEHNIRHKNTTELI